MKIKKLPLGHIIGELALSLNEGDMIVCKENHMDFIKGESYRVRIDYRILVEPSHGEIDPVTGWVMGAVIFPFDSVFEHFYTKKEYLQIQRKEKLKQLDK